MEQAPAGGNPCRLTMRHGPPSGSADSPGDHVVCESWPDVCDDRPVIAVRCHAPGGELIQCCGHGLLAAAHAWQRQLGCERLTLLMNNSLVASWREGDRTWLRFGRVNVQPCSVPDWVSDVFAGQQGSLVAATCGDARGYLVLQWPDDANLYGVQARIDRLAAHTGRALICTAAQPGEGEGRIQLRYFAPQYGVPEDSATGSAVRVLAAYWSSRFVRLTAQQCSPRGGLLLSSWSQEHVDVGGHCMDIPAEAAHA